MLQKNIYASMSDRELVKGLTAQPIDNKLHEYFFNVKCKSLLSYISTSVYNDDNTNTIIGEFYEYLSNDNWKVLRNWEGKNDCTLYSYLSKCSVRYFIARKNAENKRNEIETCIDLQKDAELIEHPVTDDEKNRLIRKAYKMLCERDRVIIRLLIIDGKDLMEAAPHIWRYINSSQPYDELTQKQIQSTVSMAKHRAVLTLADNAIKLKIADKAIRLRTH
ncbi:MAG: hypothetical protein IJY44_02195 [Bacteroidaceae bacterium]|nr:hypothetical protein [Bacteroidaceae bacterium]